MNSPTTGNRRQGTELGTERAESRVRQEHRRSRPGTSILERWLGHRQPLQGSERPFRDAGFVGDRSHAASGAAIRDGQKPPRGAKEARLADFQTPGSSRACRLANALQRGSLGTFFLCGSPRRIRRSQPFDSPRVAPLRQESHRDGAGSVPSCGGNSRNSCGNTRSGKDARPRQAARVCRARCDSRPETNGPGPCASSAGTARIWLCAGARFVR
jgi:hypothetical protein